MPQSDMDCTSFDSRTFKREKGYVFTGEGNTNGRNDKKELSAVFSVAPTFQNEFFSNPNEFTQNLLTGEISFIIIDEKMKDTSNHAKAWKAFFAKIIIDFL